ncbi:MAG: hypothetical protein C4306_04970 [Thermoleophilia bacterium]
MATTRPGEGAVRAAASRELLAPLADVWALLAEPHHLSDWWPTISAVRPDRRGLAPGARWEVVGPSEPTLFRRAYSTSVVVVREVVPKARVRWHLVAERLDLEVRLSDVTPDRTLVTVSVEGPWRPELLGRPRALPREAVSRLHALCQTTATL